MTSYLLFASHVTTADKWHTHTSSVSNVGCILAHHCTQESHTVHINDFMRVFFFLSTWHILLHALQVVQQSAACIMYRRSYGLDLLLLAVDKLCKVYSHREDFFRLMLAAMSPLSGQCNIPDCVQDSIH